MEPQAHDVLGEAVEKLTKVRDAPRIGDAEQSIIIDVTASLRTLRAMYTEHQEPTQTDPPFTMNDLNPFRRKQL